MFFGAIIWKCIQVGPSSVNSVYIEDLPQEYHHTANLYNDSIVKETPSRNKTLGCSVMGI